MTLGSEWHPSDVGFNGSEEIGKCCRIQRNGATDQKCLMQGVADLFYGYNVSTLNFKN